MVETPRRRRTSRSRRTTSVSPPAESESGLKDNIHVNTNDTTVSTRSRSKSRGRTANGSAKTNGSVDAKTNGSAKGPGSRTKHEYKKGQIVDGWLVGGDPKIDANPHFDFGGTLGVTAMMIGFPLLMYYMWVGATYYDGQFPSRVKGQSWSDLASQLVYLCYEGAFPTPKAWAIYWGFGTMQCIFYLLMPGVYSTGKPLPHEGGKQLLYYCSGMWSFNTTIVLALALHYLNIFKLYTLIDEFGPIMSVAIISGFLLSLVAYVSAFWRGAQHRMTGHHIYDFFMGAELNPRLFGLLDFKMFLEVRVPWYMLFFTTLGAAARQYDRYGYVTPEVAFLLMAHWLYAQACCKGEEMICVTWDMYYEKLGFMLIFWNMAGVPLSYCHCTIYLANHPPSDYAHSTPVLVFLFAAYLFAYWVWDTGNSQKHMFRAMEGGYASHRKTFPQMPWKYIENPKKIETQTGDAIFCDGWYGLARKIHYTADMWFALNWGLITGFNSPFPWFYPVFFACMITHRAYRDVQRCRAKYGEAWLEYERRVPYLFIPVSRRCKVLICTATFH